jgi:uncharacterized protein YkwD
MLMARRICLLLFLAVFFARRAEAQFDPLLERKLFDLANGERVEDGLPRLAWNEKLAQAARLHAARMAAHNKLSHRFDGEAGLTDRIAATGLHFGSAAENVAFATYGEDIHQGLMRSLEHRANILSKRPNALGIGVIKVTDGYYAVQDFANTTSADEPTLADKRFVAAFNGLRKEQRKTAAQLTSTESLRTYACEMAQKDTVSVKSIPIPAGFYRSIGYTTVEPEELPDPVKDIASEPLLVNLQMGSCYKATRQYPGGVYWFVIVY